MKNDKVGVLGPRGTYAASAAAKSFPEGQLIYAETLEDVFEMLGKKAEYGVVPIENSLEGSVNSTLDCLIEHSVYIVKEIVLDINLCLAAKSKNERIDLVISHPHALAQCRRFLRERHPDAVIQGRESTAAAMKEAADKARVAAVGPREAALEYGLEVIEDGIQDSKSQTRFIAISKKQGDGEKTSIIFALKDEPGSLYNLLGEFAKRDVNLKKIESRPSRKGLGDYLFFVDFEGSVNESGIEELLCELREKTSYLKVLGSY